MSLRKVHDSNTDDLVSHPNTKLSSRGYQRLRPTKRLSRPRPAAAPGQVGEFVTSIRPAICVAATACQGVLPGRVGHVPNGAGAGRLEPRAAATCQEAAPRSTPVELQERPG